MKNLRPMLAHSVEKTELDKLNYPVYTQPKLDGIRCLVIDGKAYSRKLKLIPNKYIQGLLSIHPAWLDGELVLRNGGGFNEVQSAVMSEEGEPDLQFFVFDIISDRNEPYLTRLEKVIELASREECQGFIVAVPTLPAFNKETIDSHHLLYLNKGFEGTILRCPESKYKFGRSTLKEQALLKIKDFFDEEAVILKILPLQTNQNEAEVDALGYTKRSSKKAGKVELETTGAFLCKNEAGVVFKVSSGLTAEQRLEIWQNKDIYLGKTITYRFQSKFPDTGCPRFPTIIGFRKD